MVQNTTAFIDASKNISLILHTVARPSSTHGAAEQYVHYLINIEGASIMTTTRQQNDNEAGFHSTGTPMWTRPRREMRSDANRLA